MPDDNGYTEETKFFEIYMGRATIYRVHVMEYVFMKYQVTLRQHSFIFE